MHNRPYSVVGAMFMIVVGVLAGAVVGFIYGVFGVQDADYVMSLFGAAVLGAAIWLAARLVKFENWGIKFLAGALSALIVIIWGHYLGCQWEFKDGVHHWLIHEAPVSYDPIKALPKDEAVQAYMARILEADPPHGFFSCLRVRAMEGSEVSQAAVLSRYTRRGFWMWFGWLMNALIFLSGAAAGSVAGEARPEEP